MKYIDVHAHIFPEAIAEKVINQLETYYGYPWKGRGTVPDLLSSVQEAEITRTVVFSSATKPEQVETINNYISSVEAKYPDRLIGFGTMHPDYPDYRNELKRFRGLGLHGLKFHPDFQRFFVDAPEMMRIYECVGDSMPMLFHIGDKKSDFSSPARLENVLKTLPGVKVIAAHMGGYSQWGKAWDHLIGRDCWLDISSTIHQLPDAEIVRMARAHGIERVLFASDYPAVRHTEAIADVLSLGFTGDELEKIFYKNAEKLLNITL